MGLPNSYHTLATRAFEDNFLGLWCTMENFRAFREIVQDQRFCLAFCSMAFIHPTNVSATTYVLLTELKTIYKTTNLVKWNIFCKCTIEYTLTCWIQPPGWLLGLVLEFPPLVFITALGLLFFPPLAIIQPWVFSSSHPWLLFSPRFSLFPSLGYYPTLGFPLLPTLG